jgi:hypothetical protein
VSVWDFKGFSLFNLFFPIFIKLFVNIVPLYYLFVDAKALYLKAFYARFLRIFVISSSVSPWQVFHPSLMFASKANMPKLTHLSGAPLKFKLLILPRNIRLGWKGLTVANWQTL